MLTFNIDQTQKTDVVFSFPIELKLIFEDDKVEVHTIPLNHRVYTNGFLFKEKEGPRKLDVQLAEEAHVNVAYYRKLTQGFDVENEDVYIADGILCHNVENIEEKIQ